MSLDDAVYAYDFEIGGLQLPFDHSSVQLDKCEVTGSEISDPPFVVIKKVSCLFVR